MELFKKLMNVQSELKAPKGNYNSFGKYKYRSCEDILESVKPLLKKEGLALTISDEIVNISDRFYIKSTARVIDAETGDFYENSALARESLTKTGMSESQVTGTASSYARKYALNGLFCIDDEKDDDTRDNTFKPDVDAINQKIAECGLAGQEQAILKAIKRKNFGEIDSQVEFDALMSRLEATKKGQ